MTEPNNPHRPDEAGVSGWPSEAGRDPYGQPSNPYQMPAPYSSGLPVAENHRRPYVDFGLAIKLFFKNYAVFRGRASRSEYWWTVLFNFIIAVAIQALMPILQGVGLMSAITSNSTTEFSAMSTSGVIFTMLPLAWLLAIIIPCLALTVRRLHDVNHSGWWVMAPTLCGIVSAIMMILAFVSAAANDGKPSMALLTIGIVLFVAIFVVNIIFLSSSSRILIPKHGRSTTRSLCPSPSDPGFMWGRVRAKCSDPPPHHRSTLRLQIGQHVVKVIRLDQNVPRLRPLRRPDDITGLEDVHKSARLSKAHTQLTLQH